MVVVTSSVYAPGALPCRHQYRTVVRSVFYKWGNDASSPRLPSRDLLHSAPIALTMLMARWQLCFLSCSLVFVGVVGVIGHGHEGCGHSFVAGEAKRWSQLHRQHRQLLEQQAEAGLLDAVGTQLHGAAGSSLGVASNTSEQHGRPVPRMLAASGTVPIRVWVEYQGIDSLSADGKQRLYDTVNIALGVFQKFFKVRRGCI